jgi:hypothetical protein
VPGEHVVKRLYRFIFSVARIWKQIEISTGKALEPFESFRKYVAANVASKVTGFPHGIPLENRDLCLKGMLVHKTLVDIYWHVGKFGSRNHFRLRYEGPDERGREICQSWEPLG